MLYFILPPSSFLLLFADAFPRGPGFYFHPVKLVAVLLVYFAWVRTCWWVDQDCRDVNLPAVKWDPILLGCGAAGLLLVWAVPVFSASFLALLALYLAPTLIYVVARNREVSESEQVLTSNHLKQLAQRYLKVKFEHEEKEDEDSDTPIPIRFIGKSGNGRGEDVRRVRQAQESPAYRLALELVHKAVQMRVTDIHMEPTKEEMTVRYRIDGILQPAKGFDRSEGDSILNIFKVLADLDITEKRQAQDGSFSAELQGPGPSGGGNKKSAPASRQVDFRVATAGSVSGEKMVMRLLDRSRAINDLSRLGMREKLRDQIRALVTQPHGMFIVCGPTGSGKSTTLYACLSEIDCFQRNVITVENPVEYHMPNVTQIEINVKAGKTFASELRSILRQDPDVIYIGEIRDQETAEIGCQAAQTGHMVFTTLHANDTVMALGRLIELGVKPFMVANSISAILGQRLVRVLCPKCKVAYRPNPEMLRRLNLPAARIKQFYRPPKPEDGEGSQDDVCEHCAGTGYRGRTGIYELLPITEKIRDMVKDNPNFDAIRQEAVKSGVMLLSQDGMRIVIEGETSIEELLRVSK